MISKTLNGLLSMTFSRCSTLIISLFALCLSVSSVAQKLSLQSLTDELDSPWAVAMIAEGEMFITERSGQLRYFANGVLSSPIQGVPNVYYAGQGGLLDVQLHSDFVSNRQLF